MSKQIDERRMSSIETFCRNNDIGRTKVYQEIKAKRLRVKKVGSKTMVTREAEDEWRDALPDAIIQTIATN